jgi:hypothetical protein
MKSAEGRNRGGRLTPSQKLTLCATCGLAVADWRRVNRRWCSRVCYLASPERKALKSNLGNKHTTESRQRNSDRHRELWADPIYRTKILKAREGKAPRGKEHSSWKGDEVSYSGAHRRVWRYRGQPQLCEQCGTTDQERRYEWANVTGHLGDPGDYIRLCQSCHLILDGHIRKRKVRYFCVDCGSENIVGGDRL